MTENSVPTRGPALVYITDEGDTYRLDKLPGTEGMTASEIPIRDRNILLALWETFIPDWRFRR